MGDRNTYTVSVGAGGDRSSVSADVVLVATRRALKLLQASADACGEPLPGLFVADVADGSSMLQLRLQRSEEQAVLEAVAARATAVASGRVEQPTSAERVALRRLADAHPVIKMGLHDAGAAEPELSLVRVPESELSAVSQVRTLRGYLSGADELHGGRLLRVTLRRPGATKVEIDAAADPDTRAVVEALLWSDVVAKVSVRLAKDFRTFGERPRLRSLRPWKRRSAAAVAEQMAEPLADSEPSSTWIDRLRDLRDDETE